ncbi:MAG TPA: PqqD family peptide modification chaperone [Rhizomicrobium sp.]|jgi:predicted TPR repeat methyltransferase|nr:PqqD family peptide modification chaperone [Rhizomicrobium sp.]
MANPTVNPVILLSPVEGGYVAYDPAQDNLHQLNPVAALITELCDGTRSIDEITEIVSPLTPDDEATGVARWIDEGMEAGLLVWAGSEPAARRELSAEELFELTKRLRETGKVQPAYLCGKRTVELKPEDWNAWYNLGEIAQCVGKRDEARDAYQKYLNAHPEDGEVEHLLIALKDDRPPPRASDRAIQHIYKNFAASYESRMCEDLKYAGPERLQDGIRAVIGDRAGLTMLDLGCGSGLMGVNTKWRAADLTGVDLSPEMIELARARNIYDRLEVAEITGWLDEGEAPFDLIASSDCLIYFGDLGKIVTAAARRLKPGGLFAFSMERGNRFPFHLTDTGRYTHHPDHVREVAAQAGLEVAQVNEAFLRYEYGEEVMGLYTVLRKPD